MGSSHIRGRTRVSWIGRQILYNWATKEALSRTCLNSDVIIRKTPNVYVFYSAINGKQEQEQ